MIFKNLFLDMLCVAFFVFALFSILATSSSQPELDDGAYLISSDCQSPVIEDIEISVADRAITNPTGAVFSDYGFPLDQISMILDNVGDVGGVERRCPKTFGTYASDNLVFSCSDGGEFFCTIFLDQVN